MTWWCQWAGRELHSGVRKTEQQVQSAMEQGERGRLKGSRAAGKDVEQKKEEGRTYGATSSLERSLSPELVPNLKGGDSTDAAEATTWT